jgi:CHAT domain-containing protein
VPPDAAFLLAGKFYEVFLDTQGRERPAPAAALRKAQAWLRDLTFADLKNMFPVHNGPDGDTHPESAGLPIRLGPDNDRPHAGAQHWAAFTVTGA